MRATTSSRLALAGDRGRGREGQVLDDVRPGRLHALPLRREWHHLPLHPSQQRPDGEARQPRKVRPGRGLRSRAEGRSEGQGGPADRLQRRLGRRRGHLPPPLRGPSARRRRCQPPPPERGYPMLFSLPAAPSPPVTLGLKGVPVSAGAGVLELSVTAVRVWPGGAWTTIAPRPSSSPSRRMRSSISPWPHRSPHRRDVPFDALRAS